MGKVLINSLYSSKKKILHHPCLNISLTPSPKTGKISEPFELSKRSLSLRLHMKMKQCVRINYIYQKTKGMEAACFVPFRDHKAVRKPIYLACSRRSLVSQSSVILMTSFIRLYFLNILEIQLGEGVRVWNSPWV